MLCHMSARHSKLPKLGDLVVLFWLDIQTDSGWAPEHASPGLAQCKTVGWITHVDAASITVAASFGESGGEIESNLRKCIPRGCVTHWTVLPK